MLHSKDKGCTAAQFEHSKMTPELPLTSVLHASMEEMSARTELFLSQRFFQEYLLHPSSSQGVFCLQLCDIFWKRTAVSSGNWSLHDFMSPWETAAKWKQVTGWQKVVEEKPKSAASTIAVVSQVGRTVTRWSKYFLVLVRYNFWSLLLHP